MQKSVSQQPLSCIKEGGGNRPVINLKHLNNFIPYQLFKMKGLNLLQNMLQKGDMCKLDLKDAYFCVPLKKESRKYVRFQWEGTLYEFFCLCFGLGPSPLIFQMSNIFSSNCSDVSKCNGRHFDLKGFIKSYWGNRLPQFKRIHQQNFRFVSCNRYKCRP